MNFLNKIKENKEAYAAAHGGYTRVWTDGGCQTHSPFIGAYAWTSMPPTEPHKGLNGVGRLRGTTNNRMELMAIYKALEELEIGPPIILYSDSMYAINALTAWGGSWVTKGWVTGEGKPVKNRDLIEPMLQLVGLHSIEFQHVKGHGDDALNNHVDQLCTQEIKKANKAHQYGQHIPVDPFGGVE